MSENLWQAFKTSSDRAAIFIIRRDLKYRTAQNMLIFLTFTLYSICNTILLLNMIQLKEGVAIAAVDAIFVLMSVVIIQVLFEMKREKNNIAKVILWFTEPTWKKFHTSLQPGANNRFIRIRNITTRLILLQIKVYDFLAVFGSLGVATAMQFIPSLRYQLPIPWHLPIEDYKNWNAFFVSLGLQVTVSVFMAQVIGLFGALMIAFYLHVGEFLDITSDAIEQLREDIVKQKCRDLDQALYNFAKMIASCVDVMATFTKLMATIVMCFEVLSFFSIFTNAFLILIVRQKEHYVLACNVLVLNVVTLGIAYINDILKDKLSNVSYALYKLPWDEFSPKQRSFITLAMKCTDTNVVFKSGKIHEFNLERFGNVTKQAYSNALVLKRVLEKTMVDGFE